MNELVELRYLSFFICVVSLTIDLGRDRETRVSRKHNPVVGELRKLVLPLLLVRNVSLDKPAVGFAYGEKFGQHAAQRPYVHLHIVVFLNQNKLRGTIVSGADVR